MTTALSPVIASRLEKAAVDNGFDQELPREGDWLGFASTQCPLRVWLGTFGDAAPLAHGASQGILLATFSQQNVARALGEHGTPMAAPLPKGALGGRTVTDIPSLHRLLRRAFQLSKTLPDELLHSFEKQTATLPKTTEAERLVVQRVGQDLFRHGLLEYWEGRCAITGLAVPELLRASHIKPWADCETDAERLDVYNGILLAPHLDAAFDRGLITVQDDGGIVVSDALDAGARAVLGLNQSLRARGITDGHRGYLPWHRQRVFEMWKTGHAS
jgi:putative restriction endonuclease